MKIIDISRKKFSSLSNLQISQGIFNTEAQMFTLEHKREQKVVKLLYHQSGQVFANKLYTVEMLDVNKEYLPESFVIPDALISVSGSIKGFTVPFVKGINLSTILRDSKVPVKEQLYYLKEIGSILEQLKFIRQNVPDLELHIGDLHESNFIVNPDKKSLSVIDLDSCKIGRNNSAVVRYLTPYSVCNEFGLDYKYRLTENGLGYMKVDANTDLYCYIMTILNYLYGENVNNMSLDEFYNYLSYLDNLGFNKDFLHALISIVLRKDNENPSNYLDSLTDTQIYRARNVVYKHIKTK